MGFTYKSNETQQYFHKGTFSICANMMTSSRMGKDYIKYLWCKIVLPDEKSICWNISKNEISMQQYVPKNHEMRNRVFVGENTLPYFYRGYDHEDLRKLKVTGNNNERILLVVDKKTEDITEKSQELTKIFDLGNEILNFLQKKEVGVETTPNEIDLFINEPIFLSQIQELESCLLNWNLFSSPILQDIIKMDFFIRRRMN